MKPVAMWLTCLALAVSSAQASPLPRPDHIVIVIEENRSYRQIIGNPSAPYINALARRGLLLTRSFGVTHPSQPNYLALFSGSTHGYRSNACPLQLDGDNLASALTARGYGFASYLESLPRLGDLSCADGAYRRKHNPAANWSSLRPTLLPFSFFPKDFSRLPTVSLVIPDQDHDMHDGTVAAGDAWLHQHIDSYARWAVRHNSLLIVTWDEDDGSSDNHIATILLGAMVKPGRNSQRIDHYGVLRMIEEMYDLSLLGESAQAEPISGVWRPAHPRKK